MASLAENIRNILEQIHEFEHRYHRPERSVTLVAASKRQSIDKIRQANRRGIHDFGESYLQEAQIKISELAALDICWHFIGPIQSNKTRAISNHFQWVHSVDSLKIAQRLSDQRNELLSPLNVCIQVNLSNERSKSGIPLENTAELCRQVAVLPNLHLRGLMTIPARSDDLATQRRQFSVLSTEFNRLATQFPHWDTLSMGMSGDFEAAIAEGSTMVRIGTALFGPRI